MDEIELIETVSRHPIYGIVSYYERICIREQWYEYDRVKDRLVRLTRQERAEGDSNGEQRGLF